MNGGPGGALGGSFGAFVFLGVKMAEEGQAAEGATVEAGGENASSQAADNGTTQAAQPTQPEAFHDPASIPPELQPAFKRMQASYTRKMQALSSERNELRTESESYRRLMNDPAYARQMILEAAPRLGLHIAEPGQQQAVSKGNGVGGAPADFIDTVKSQLAPELQWAARDIANATWAASQAAMQPLVQRQQLDTQQRRGEQYEELAAELSAKVPDWQEHEDEMAQALAFLSSDQLVHPLYGSKVEMLYNIVTKNTAATRQAIARITQAPRNRTVTGRPETSTTPNLDEAVRKAPTMQDAWKMAAKAAAEKIGVQLER